MPLYRRFREEVKWGDYEAIAAAVDEAWQIARDGRIDEDRIHALTARCEEATPDSERFDSPLTSAALSAAVAAADAVECGIEARRASCADAARMSVDAIMLVLSTPQRTTRDLVMEPLLNQELRWQVEDLNVVKSQADPQVLQTVSRIRGEFLGTHLMERLATIRSQMN
jgi:hypothetical protein